MARSQEPSRETLLAAIDRNARYMLAVASYLRNSGDWRGADALEDHAFTLWQDVYGRPEAERRIEEWRKGYQPGGSDNRVRPRR